MPWAVVLAAAGDWLTLLMKIIVPLVFFIIYLFNQMTSAKNAPRKVPQPPREPERALRPPQAPNKQSVGTQGQLQAEIEQFLKKANERRGDRGRRPGASTVNSPAKSPAQPPSPPKPPREPLSQRPREPEPKPRELSSVASSVEKHLSNRGFAQRAEHLADDIVRADQQMEEHLQKSFSRRVGTLGPSTTEGVSTPLTDVQPVVVAQAASAAAGVGVLLGNRENLQQAYILKEILDRPEHRW